MGAAFGPVILCIFFFPGLTLRGTAAGILGGFLNPVLWVVTPIKTATYDLFEMKS